MNKETFEKVIRDIRTDTINDSILVLYENGEEKLSQNYISALDRLASAYEQKDFGNIYIESLYLNRIKQLLENGYLTSKDGRTIHFNNELMYCAIPVFKYFKEHDIPSWDIRYLLRENSSELLYKTI